MAAAIPVSKTAGCLPLFRSNCSDDMSRPDDCGSYCSTNSCPSPPPASCGSGEYLSSGSCRSCQTGRYMSQSSHTRSSCWNCPTGRYEPSTGSSLCNSCPSSRPRSESGSTSSSDCTQPIPSGATQTATSYGSYVDEYGRTLYYESQSAAERALRDAGDALGDAVCDAIAQYGCVLHPECCGLVRCRMGELFESPPSERL